MKSGKKVSLIMQILIAMVLGVIVGVIWGKGASCIQFIGTVWLNIIKMFIVPVVICMVVRGVSSLDSPKDLGRIGLRVIAFYVITNVFALGIGILTTVVLKPGIGFVFEAMTTEAVDTTLPTVSSFVTGLFSTNIFATFSSGDMLQCLVIALLIGGAIVFMGEKGKPVADWFSNMADLCMALMDLAMRIAPVGVFCLMASAMGTYGSAFLGSMAKLIGTFYLGCLLHWLLVYALFLWINTGINPITFAKKAFATIATAVSTCSSAATVPTNLKVAKENFNVSESVANFAIPLGANMNQDGMAILIAAVMLFCAQSVGMTLTLSQIINMVVVATIVTSGSPGVPGGGISRLMIVAATMGLPLEIIAMISAFYRCFDMGTTTMSVMGDLSASIVIDRWEKKATQKAVKE